MKRPTITCRRCRLVRTENEWATLPAVAHIADPAMEGLVSRWPDQKAVVVRACTCGATMARLAPSA